MPKSKHIRVWGVVLLLFGTLVLVLLGDGIPERSSLTEVTGQLRSLEKTTSKGGGLSSVQFSLSTDARHFSYHSSAGRIDAVWDALSRAGNAKVRVLIDPADSHSPPGDDRSFHAVLEVRIAEETIRPYSQVAQSLRSDNFIGEVLGYGTSAIGAMLLAATILRRR